MDMKKGLTIILGFAVGLVAGAFAQTIVQRPQYPQTGLSYVGYGDQVPTTELFDGELFIDVDGAGDSGALFQMYDGLNAEWDRFLNASAAGTVNFLPKFETGGTSLTDSQTIRSVGAPAANTDGSVVEIIASINQADAGNVVSLLDIDVDSPANHLGAAIVAGINFDNDAVTAAGVEVGAYFNDQWDIDVGIVDGGNLELSSPNDATILDLETDAARTYGVGGRGTVIDIDHGITAFMSLTPTLTANDNAGDQRNVLLIDVAVPNGSAGLVNAINIDAITDDINTLDAAIFIEGGWDAALAITERGSAPTANPLANTGWLFYDDSVDYSGAGGVDCWLVWRDAGGTNHQVVEVQLNGNCP